MKSEEQIREELKKHIAKRKVIFNDPEKQNDKKTHEIYIEVLEWVLGGNSKWLNIIKNYLMNVLI